MIDRSTLEDDIEAARVKFPLGSSVIYAPVLDWPEREPSIVRSLPWALGDGTIVLKIACRAGGVSIDHLEKAIPPRHPATSIGE